MPYARHALCLAIIGCVILIAGATKAGELVQVDGIPHVRNGAEPARGHETVQLEELWRVGGPDDDAFFGLITQVRVDEAGDIYLLDSQLCEVAVYSPEGEYRRKLFHQGEGPGEITRPRDFALLGDGSVAVVRELPGLLVRVDRENNPLPNIEIKPPGGSGFVATNACHAGGSTVVLGGLTIQQTEGSVQERMHYLGAFDQQGNETARFASVDATRDYANFVLAEREALPAFWWATTVGADGRVYTAPARDRYAIEVFSPGGERMRVIEREYKHCRRTDNEYQRLYDSFDNAMQEAAMPYTIEIERDEYDILPIQHGLRVRGDDSLWVLPSRGVRDQPPGIMLTFDVFDPEGHFARKVSFACPHDGTWDGFFFAGSDRYVVVTGHVEAVLAQYGAGISTYEEGADGSAMEVICYGVARD